MVVLAYEWTKVQYTPPLAYEKHYKYTEDQQLE